MFVMFRTVVLALVIGLLLFPPPGKAQVPFHERVLETYSFQPHSLSSAEIAKKSVVLDAFWNEAKAQKNVVEPELRKELSDFSNPPFFLYDGSMLLLSLSDTHENRMAALAAMSHCDLRDVQLREYFLQVHRLAAGGEDATAAALHVLDDPKFQVLIPQHALTLGQNYVIVYLLLPMEEKVWLQPAIKRLSDEKDETAQRSLLLAIWYAQTSEADKALTAYANDSSKPESLRKYAQELIKRDAGVIPGVKSAFADEESVRRKRRERMKDVSDEALYDLDSYTKELIAKRK